MLKKAAFSPAQPRRAKTRRSAGKAAVPQLTTRFTFHASRFTLLWNDARTTLADFFSILLRCLCRFHMREAQAGVGLSRLATAFMNNPG